MLVTDLATTEGLITIFLLGKVAFNLPTPLLETPEVAWDFQMYLLG